VTISAVHPTPATASTGDTPTPPVGGEGDSLLPEPAAASGIGINDAMAMIYTCISKQSSADVKTGEDRVDVERAQRDLALKAEQAAMDREEQAEGSHSKGLFATVGGLLHDVTRDVATAHFAALARDTTSDVKAAWNSPNFWRDVEAGARITGEVAAVVGSAALTVCTFGGGAASAVLVGSLILSTAGTVESNCHVLEALGVNANVASWIGIGASVGGAALGGVGGLMSAPGKVGLVVQAVSVASQGASGGAQIVAGVAHIKNGNFQADAEDAEADATAADDRMQSIQRVMGMVLDGIKDVTDSHQRALSSLAGAMQTNDQTMVIAASGRMA
jgi:hypothetical protein